MALPTVDPAEVGLSAERLDLIRERAREWIDCGEVHRTLVLLVARHGAIAFHEAFGVDGPEPDAAPLTVDAIFPLMSQTKVITATLAMQLAEDGLLGLTRPVREYLPEFVGARKDTILVEHLLTHTSGIDDVDFFGATGRLVPQMLEHAGDGSDGQHPVEHLFLELAYCWPAAHPAGDVGRYANVNYLLLGEILRRVSSRSLDDLARERLFGPLGMGDSSFGVPEDKADRVVRRSFEQDRGARFAYTKAGWGCLGGAAGAFSTAADLAAFMQLFLDGGRCPDGRRLLHPSSVERMITDQAAASSVELFGMTIRRPSSGIGWLVSNSEPTPGFPKPPDGSILHGGTGFQLPWADPRTGLVGVFCSVADRLRSENGNPLDLAHESDLFVNLVTSAVID